MQIQRKMKPVAQAFHHKCGKNIHTVLTYSSPISLSIFVLQAGFGAVTTMRPPQEPSVSTPSFSLQTWETPGQTGINPLALPTLLFQLICNSHILKCTLKMYSSVRFSTFTKLYNHHHCLIPEHFITPKRNPIPYSPHPSPRQPLICFLWICFVWTFHTIGIIQYAAFT